MGRGTCGPGAPGTLCASPASASPTRFLPNLFDPPAPFPPPTPRGLHGGRSSLRGKGVIGPQRASRWHLLWDSETVARGGTFFCRASPRRKRGEEKKRGMGEMKSFFPPSQIGTGLQMKMLHLEGCDKMEKTALEASEAASLSYLLCPCPREMAFSTDGANPERGTKAVFKIRSLRTLAHVLKCLISRLQHFPFLFLCFFKKRNP